MRKLLAASVAIFAILLLFAGGPNAVTVDGKTLTQEELKKYGFIDEDGSITLDGDPAKIEQYIKDHPAGTFCFYEEDAMKMPDGSVQVEGVPCEEGRK